MRVLGWLVAVPLAVLAVVAIAIRLAGGVGDVAALAERSLSGGEALTPASAEQAFSEKLASEHGRAFTSASYYTIECSPDLIADEDGDGREEAHCTGLLVSAGSTTLVFGSVDSDLTVKSLEVFDEQPGDGKRGAVP